MKTISRYIMTLALLITAVGGAWAADTYTVTFKANGNTKTVENVTLPHTFELDPIITELYPSLSGGSGSPAGTSASGNTNVTAYYNNSKHYATISASFEGAVTVTGQFFKDFTNYQYTLEINCMENLVAISDDKTEASFTMPASDVTAEYELVRDMSVQMTATMGDGTDGVRYRVKKAQQGEGYEPADLNMMQVLALVAVNDGIEQKALTLNQDFFCRIYKLDEQTLQPVGDGMLLSEFNFAPGLYALKAFAQNGSDYDGETALSNTFKLFQGYEVEVAAKEFITYYKDEPLYADPQTSADAVLYTITSVSNDQAVLSAAIETSESNPVHSRTPLLVYNPTDVTKKFLLIPADQDPEATQTFYSGFTGTLTATTIAASTTTQNNYALNGKQFVWVKNAISIAANKAWLAISATNAPVINLVFGDAANGDMTGIGSMVNGQSSMVNGDWYDLSGRKLDKKPTQKGIYINNGRKVVIK